MCSPVSCCTRSSIATSMQPSSTSAVACPSCPAALHMPNSAQWWQGRWQGRKNGRQRGVLSMGKEGRPRRRANYQRHLAPPHCRTGV